MVFFHAVSAHRVIWLTGAVGLLFGAVYFTKVDHHIMKETKKSLRQRFTCQGMMPHLSHSAADEPYDVRGFWHIGALDNPHSPWKEIVMDQVQAIKESDMMDDGIVDRIEATFVGLAPPQEGVVLPEPFFHASFGGSEKYFEFPTLRRLESYCHGHPSARVMYIHNKGASKNKDNGGWQEIVAWRKFLEYYTIHRYQDCLYELEKDDVLVCGQLIRPVEPFSQHGENVYPPHMSGNFWWAKCAYVNALPRIDSLDLKDRMQAEWYIGGCMSTKIQEFDIRARVFPMSAMKSCDNYTAYLGDQNVYEKALDPLWYSQTLCGPAVGSR